MGIASSVVQVGSRYLLSVLAPPRCAACDEGVSVLSTFCPACASTVERAPPDASGPVAALAYSGATAQAIVRMKYGGRADLARPLGDLLWRALEPHAAFLGSATVVPVPLHPLRLAERGFNQSALLARTVAAHLGAVFSPLALRRMRDTPRQALLEREARLSNVQGAFCMRRGAMVSGQDVLLVDDVCTTGATIGEAATVLREGGARSVTAAVVARAV
jgi:ComF family protein